MLTLSGTTGYAINALAFLAGGECNLKMIGEISRCSGVPSPYLAKIMRKLNEGGIVQSKRGYKGGIWLAKTPDKITLLEIVQAIDGEQYLTGCFLGSEACSDERSCPTHFFWKSMREQVASNLATLTLADVVKFNARQKAQVAHGEPLVSLGGQGTNGNKNGKNGKDL